MLNNDEAAHGCCVKSLSTSCLGSGKFGFVGSWERLQASSGVFREPVRGLAEQYDFGLLEVSTGI
jgi:hypothetical protein